MSRRCLLGVLVTIALVAIAWIPTAGQAAAQGPAATQTYTPPLTPDGQPDLQGVWGYATITPLERPPELAEKPVLTAQEAADLERRTAEIQDRDRRDHASTSERGSDGRTDLDRAYNQFWWDFGTKTVGTRQTSLVVDPPNGRIPPLTPEGQKRVRANRGLTTNSAREEGGAGRSFDSIADRPLGERCLQWRTAGPPMVPGPYNNNVQLLQSRDYVVILNEMIHEHRMVPLDGRPHLDPEVRQWMGDSRGHWEGSTLVVDTTNFSAKTAFQGASEKLHLIERFTRVAPDVLMYEFTVDDPTTFTQTWKAAIPMTLSQEPIYEYACHEGNYSMATILAGARAQEKALAEAAKD
ncbi:MAG: hypothetical protein GEU82_18495 [Luteitalea sp.]|nr:hypothetical protein [Luteitalea sp.]